MKAKRPSWDLTRVKEIASRKGGIQLSQTRAIAFFDPPRLAYPTAAKVIAGLSEDTFCETVEQQFGEKMDIYVVIVEQANWMLKFTVWEEVPQVMVVSLHPLERPIKTKKGVRKP